MQNFNRRLNLRRVAQVTIGEAKTCEDLDNANTKEQFTVFSNRKMTSGKSKDKIVPFYILVTRGCESKLAATSISLV